MMLMADDDVCKCVQIKTEWLLPLALIEAAPCGLPFPLMGTPGRGAFHTFSLLAAAAAAVTIKTWFGFATHSGLNAV